MKVMRTRAGSKAHDPSFQVRGGGRERGGGALELASVFTIVIFCLLWMPQRVTGDCNSAIASNIFNLSSFSSAPISLVSHSWIDGGGSLRMAPPAPEQLDPRSSEIEDTDVLLGNKNGPSSSFSSSIGQGMFKAPVSGNDSTITATATLNSVATFFSFSLVSVKQVPATLSGLAFLILPDPNVVLFPITNGITNPSDFGNGNGNAGANVEIWHNSTSHGFAVKLKKWNVTSSTSSSNIDGVPAVEVPFPDFLQDGKLNYVWIDYNAPTMHLQVQVSNTTDITSAGAHRWVLLSTTYNLSGLFHGRMYTGFSSLEKISVQSWNFGSDYYNSRNSSTTNTSDPECALPPSLQPNAAQPPDLLPNQPFPRPFPDPNNNDDPGPHPNGDLPHGPGDRPPREEQHSSIVHHQLIIYIGVSCGCLALVLLVLLFGCCAFWRKGKYMGASSVPDQDVPFVPQIFTYKTLSLATNDFDERTLLGRGGFGSVYKGLVADDEGTASISTIVAVKRIECNNDAQKERQFIAEVSSIGRLRHRNLVQLLGWCHEKGEFLLVYDYMPNGSLDRLLFGTQANARVLPWESRYNIVSGVATALAYLHGEWEKQVVHRDVKASNVLLDSNFNPRLGDFGLARLIEHNKNPKSSAIAGTLGYLAPEITITGKATDKTDVFSFGALTLEVACGRRPIERTRPPDEVVLVDWVWSLLSEGKIEDAIDPRLQQEQRHVQQHQQQQHQQRASLPFVDDAITMLSVGLLCSHPDPGARPSMRQVVRILNGEVCCPPVPDSKPIPPFSAFRRPATDFYHSSPTARAMAAMITSNKPSIRTQSRVSDSSSVK